MLPLILFGAAYLISRTTKETTEFADGGTLGAGSFAKGGETFTEKADSLKGGIKYYSLDIDTEDGEQIRDLQFKSLEKATKEYKKYKASMEYDGEPIEDIQLIKVLKNGDYESIGGDVMAKGGMAQGYDDREDERLAMKLGKISGKDFVGSRKAKEHSRRDDARFEERNK